MKQLYWISALVTIVAILLGVILYGCTSVVKSFSDFVCVVMMMWMALWTIAVIIASVIEEHIVTIRRKAVEAAERREKEWADNILSQVSKICPLRQRCNENGFILIRFHFGRFYVDYQSDTNFCDRSVTKSIRVDGSLWENYPRLNTRYGFISKEDEEKFNTAVEVVQSIILINK